LTGFNQVYGTALSSFEELPEQRQWPAPDGQVTEDDGLFMAHIAEQLYLVISRAVRQGSPNHLFFGERYQLRDVPDPVLSVIGRHVDVFLTQALIRSPQRPPEWQTFQQDGYRHEYALTQKPMIIVDWATPFSLGATFENFNGTIKHEAAATQDMQGWLQEVFELPFVVGVFKCQLIGTHGNDRWFEGKAKRTLLKDDGTYFEHMTPGMQQAHREALHKVYQKIAQ